jgi:acyl-homoserine lactone acylase PvdQ
MALEALEKAVAHIEKTYGKPEVPWGEIDVVVRGGTFPMDGTGLYDVLHPDEGVEQDNGQMHCNDGWGHLLIVMEGSPKQVWSLLPYGESQHPSSPHYNDQAKLHSRRQAKQFWLTPADILEHTESFWGDRDRIRRIQ